MKKTRKLLALMMAFLMVFAAGLSACGSKSGEEEGQNPIMNFVGYYVCDRANIFISADGDEGAAATVTWGSSAWENSSWTMSGTFDPETLKFEYHDGVRTDYVYSENGDVESQTEVYTGGHGFMTFSEGDPLTLTWQEDQENVADGMVFEYVGANPEESEVGMINPWSDVGSVAEATEGAGLDAFAVPEGEEISLGKLEASAYRCMDGLAEIIFEFPASEITVRKGKRELEIAQGDISGDYGEYKYDWNMDIGGKQVKCFGNRKGEATKTIWNDGTYDYAVLALGLGGDEDFGLSEEDLTTLVNGVE